MRGESCNAWFRDCEYLNQCTLSTNIITTLPTTDSVLDDKVYDIEVSLDELIQAQIAKLNIIPIHQIPFDSSEAKPMDGDTFL